MIASFKSKQKLVEIKMAMAQHQKVFVEVKMGFDEMKHKVMGFIALQTNPTFLQSYHELSY